MKHSWKAKNNGYGTFYQCEKCGITKEKYYGMPWHYFDDEGKFIDTKAPICNKITTT